MGLLDSYSEFEDNICENYSPLNGLCYMEPKDSCPHQGEPAACKKKINNRLSCPHIHGGY
jgi:hypothetical protein